MSITTRADGLILISAADTYTLPTAVGIDGDTYRIKNTGTATLATVNTTGGQTIDGAASVTILPSGCLIVTADAGNWVVTSSGPNPSLGGVGGMFEYENAVSMGIDQVNTYHPMWTSGVVTGTLDGWTFTAGLNGTFIGRRQCRRWAGHDQHDRPHTSGCRSSRRHHRRRRSPATGLPTRPSSSSRA